jgi:hypothetical protein
VPVQIVPPGDVESVSSFFPPLYQSENDYIIKTGEDTETLKIVEASIQANFKNGLPPHLQADAKSTAYLPGSDQSRIFVASYSEFLSLKDKDIQGILRHRLILVHGNPIEYDYGWDLRSFSQVHDVDTTTTVHGGISIPLLYVFTKLKISCDEF